jgi:molybdate-binding protein/DNA-binding XRE family transcriptional regulator
VNRVRELRLQRALGQAELGRRAGISRQSVNAIERERAQASVQTALGLARALDVSVEDLFGFTAGAQARWLDDEISPAVGMRVAVERWDQTEVARPLAACPPDSFPAAHGAVRRVTGDQVQVEIWQARPALFLYGCDPALGLLASHVNRNGSEGWWWNATNARALALLKAERARVVALHHGVLEARAVDRSCLRIRLVGWESGWLVAKGNPKRISGADDLARPELTVAVREEGAESRRLFEQQMAQADLGWADLGGRAIVGRSQLAVARLVAQGQADMAIGHAGAAVAWACDLVPIRQEVTDLLIPQKVADQPELAALLTTMTSHRFRRDLASSGPYDTARTGDQVG